MCVSVCVYFGPSEAAVGLLLFGVFVVISFMGGWGFGLTHRN